MTSTFIRSTYALIFCMVISGAWAEDYTLETLTDDLLYPWSLAQLPNGDLLITTKPGKLWHLNPQGGDRRLVTGTPEVAWVGQGGLLDVAVHPDYAGGEHDWIYLSYSKVCRQGLTAAVSRYRIREGALTDAQHLFEARPCNSLTWHFGGRMALDDHGYLFLTVGDRGEREGSQQLDRHHGKVIRLHDDGRIPEDNPFVSQPEALPEIWSYGHRNPQGMAFHPETGELWLHEHGPKGGDELNRVLRGENYGWPLVTFGREYFGGTISEQTQAPGMISPVWQWTPSIAPSGFAIYAGDKFPQWNGHFFIGALKFRQVHRLEPTAEGGLREHILSRPEGRRIRDVRVLADGHLYLLTDDENGQLLRYDLQ